MGFEKFFTKFKAAPQCSSFSSRYS